MYSYGLLALTSRFGFTILDRLLWSLHVSYDTHGIFFDLYLTLIPFDEVDWSD